MNLTEMKKITAVVRTSVLERVERHLEAAGVPGMTIAVVQGYGEYANYFHEPPVTDYARLEIFVESAHVEAIVEKIAESARTGLAGDGVIAVSAVEAFRHIHGYGEGSAP